MGTLVWTNPKMTEENEKKVQLLAAEWASSTREAPPMVEEIVVAVVIVWL